MATFSIGLLSKRLLVDIRQPIEEPSQRMKCSGISTYEYASSRFGDFKFALDLWATPHIVYPTNNVIFSQFVSPNF